MKKKIVTFLITVAMGMTLAACGGNSETSTNTDSSDESAQSESNDTAEDYKTLSEGGSIEIEGMSGYAVSSTAINGKFVLIASSSGDVSQVLIDAFNAFE